MTDKQNPYDILGVPIDSSIEDVKKAYKIIALKSHPDKLNNISDTNEKNRKIKEFMEATNAYNKILNGDLGDDWDYVNYDFENYKFTFEDWEETINNIRQSDLLKDLVSMFMKYKSKAKKHNINVDIKYQDYFNTSKKKLRLFLKGIEEPVYINLNCKKFPACTINYIDDNDNEHEIHIQMNLINDKEVNHNYYHYDEDEDNEGTKDLYYDLPIDTIDYLIGGTKEISFVTKEIILITIEPFASEFRIENKGINKGDLIIKFIYEPIKKENWDKLLDADKNEMVRILEKLKNDIKIY